MSPPAGPQLALSQIRLRMCYCITFSPKVYGSFRHAQLNSFLVPRYPAVAGAAVGDVRGAVHIFGEEWGKDYIAEYYLGDTRFVLLWFAVVTAGTDGFVEWALRLLTVSFLLPDDFASFCDFLSKLSDVFIGDWDSDRIVRAGEED